MEKHSQIKIGKKVRDIRMNKNISINEVSKKTGLTSSFISQFERGLTSASIDSIYKLVEAIDTKLSVLFNENMNQESQIKETIIVRKNERPSLSYSGMTDYLLTHPDSKLEVYYSNLNPGSSSAGKYYHSGEEEFLLILNGKLEIGVENETYILNEGDTITLDCSLTRYWKNISDSVTRILWIIYS